MLVSLHRNMLKCKNIRGKDRDKRIGLILNRLRQLITCLSKLTEWANTKTITAETMEYQITKLQISNNKVH